MIKRSACFGIIIVLLAACAPAAAPAQVDVGTQAIFASQTRDAAGSAANVLSLLAAQTALAATSTRQAQVNQLTDAETRTALEAVRVQPTQTLEAKQTEQAHLEATESAQGAATVRANFATYTAQTPTARAIATGTAEAQANASATAVIVAQAAHETETRTAQVLAVEAAQHAQDVTWEPVQSFFWKLVPLVFVSLLLLVCLLGLWKVFDAFANYIDSRALDRKNTALQKLIIAGRDGTPQAVMLQDEYGNIIISRIPVQAPAYGGTALLPPSEATRELSSETPPAEGTPSDPADLLRVRGTGGDTFITKGSPEENEYLIKRQLALRLLRDGIQHYARRGVDPRATARIPGFRELDWSSETWVRAVESLKPYILTKSGRGGGTFCGPEYPNLVRLYDAVGSGKVRLGGASAAPQIQAPLPQQEAAA